MFIASIIAGIFAALVIAKSFDEFRRGREPLIMFLFWLTIWATVLIFAVAPQAADWVRVMIFGQNAGLGTIFGISVTFILFITYRIYLKAERTERLVNQLISDIALSEFNQKNNRAQYRSLNSECVKK